MKRKNLWILGLVLAPASVPLVACGSGGGGAVTAQKSYELAASDGAANDRFGVSVSVSSDGNTVVAGAFEKNSSQGAAYVYK
jgi:ABC-type oligopeptide transport system substrate-binding subunit